MSSSRPPPNEPQQQQFTWTRTPHAHHVNVPLTAGNQRFNSKSDELNGLALRVVLRPVPERERGRLVPKGTRYATVFLINERPAAEKPEQDKGYIFQTGFTLTCDCGFVPRPNLRGAEKDDDIDEQIGNLQHDDCFEFGVGHGVSVEAKVTHEGNDVKCHQVSTAWMPSAEIEKVAAKKAYDKDRRAADPYMTLVGYFNSLRELGGSQRIVEDEVRARLLRIGLRRRVNESSTCFTERKIDYECVELTSRRSADEVKEAKARLDRPFYETAKGHEPVDVALASNMISVGVDIQRLGLMVVCGQPKTTAEYVQSSSRVGRDDKRPGLVVTLLNVHNPRDRSHFEHFSVYHESFYRGVEATSVTPFSPRAVDRGLPGLVVALARLSDSRLTRL